MDVTVVQKLINFQIVDITTDDLVEVSFNNCDNSNDNDIDESCIEITEGIIPKNAIVDCYKDISSVHLQNASDIYLEIIKTINKNFQ